MKREKIEDRTNLYKDYDLQEYVLSKSDERCCHCGKKAYFPFKASIDHFIPLSQGGTNRKHNLIMLCKDCNKEKGDKIKDLSYVPYLLPKYQDELYDYYQSYINSFEYIDRNKLLAADEYKVMVERFALNFDKKRMNKIKNYDKFCKPYAFKSADFSDFGRIFHFLMDYCDKYDIPHSTELMEMQLSFWYKFGAIYYYENSLSELNTIMVILLAPNNDWFKDEMPYVVKNYVFSKYSTEQTTSIVYNAIDHLPRTILKEQNLVGLPVITAIYREDKLVGKVFPYKTDNTENIYLNNDTGMFYQIYRKITLTTEDYTITDADKKKVSAFIASFKDDAKTKERMVKYFKECMSQELTWLLYDILTPFEIRDYEILQEPEEIEHNLGLCKAYKDFEEEMKKDPHDFWEDF